MNKTLLIASMALALAACGGGGGDDDGPAPQPATSPAEGLYTGKTSANQDIAGLVLDDGTYYVIYTSLAPISLGVIQGKLSAANGNFSSNDGKDFSVTSRGIFDVAINGTYATKGNLNGTVRYPATGQTATFTSTYDKNYELTPSLATLAGTYSGTSVIPEGGESATITVASSGTISGAGASGCRIEGAAKPRARGNAYDITVTFGPSPCARPGQKMSGVAYYSAEDRSLIATGTTSDRSAGVLFVGTR
ncbi:hypothetical protein [Cupriavidus sp. UGS-1]|uniref:hypothetical protein n=1 Tax=Cupriavidus sp. UGS-1 TaxID=2899826 RepID=UPI001E4D5FCC|nr:hypothetical protein [Cupriavidus sp. UGS-1]MCD9122578.1 hypothetical protein [Cupriavidus sp. UGS-1]